MNSPQGFQNIMSRFDAVKGVFDMNLYLKCFFEWTCFEQLNKGAD